MSDALTSLDHGHTALLVMDYQPGVLQRLDDADALVARARAAIATARELGITVGYVHVALSDDERAAVPATNKMFARIRDMGTSVSVDAASSAVDERLAPQDGDIVVRKTRVGAFSTTDLDRQLRQRGIDTLLLAGISTSGVVLSTVRDAADRDYRLFVAADLCADFDGAVHTLLLERVFPRQADVIASDALAEL
jgi:nicotinamidase-related amidase